MSAIFSPCKLCCRLSAAVSAADSATLTAAVGQENLLLQTYGVTLPAIHRRNADVVPGTRDAVATKILEMLQPRLLLSNVPLAVAGDGNCMFRAVSRALYGTESLYGLLRLLTALEMSCHPAYYDATRADYSGNINDASVYITAYQDLLHAACTVGASSEFIHMYAVSAVVGVPIKSVHPSNSLHFQAWNETVVGRNVQQHAADIQLLWSSSALPSDSSSFAADHFVVLHHLPAATNFQPAIPITVPASSQLCVKRSANANSTGNSLLMVNSHLSSPLKMLPMTWIV